MEYQTICKECGTPALVTLPSDGSQPEQSVFCPVCGHWLTKGKDR